MKQSIKRVLMILSLLGFGISAQAAGYVENLYLCDLGIMNANIANQRGVDFIQYVQNGKTMSVTATSTFSTAMNIANAWNSGFDQWNPVNGINNVSINLESDFYGTEYFLTYCYTWDRTVPSDQINYDVNFFSVLTNPVPKTQWTVDTICNLKANNGEIIATSTLSSYTATNSLSVDYSSMRCTIKLNFKEDSFVTTPRPHSGDPISANPIVNVRVNP